MSFDYRTADARRRMQSRAATRQRNQAAAAAVEQPNDFDLAFVEILRLGGVIKTALNEFMFVDAHGQPNPHITITPAMFERLLNANLIEYVPDGGEITGHYRATLNLKLETRNPVASNGQL